MPSLSLTTDKGREEIRITGHWEMLPGVTVTVTVTGAGAGSS